MLQFKNKRKIDLLNWIETKQFKAQNAEYIRTAEAQAQVLIKTRVWADLKKYY